MSGPKRADYYSDIAQRARTDLGANEFGTVAFITEAMAHKHNLGDKLDPQGRNQLSQALIRGGIELAEAVRARYEGDFSFEPKDKILARKVEAVFSAPVAAQPATETPKAAEHPSRLRHRAARFFPNWPRPSSPNRRKRDAGKAKRLS